MNLTQNLRRAALIAGALTLPLIATAESARESVSLSSVVVVKYSPDQAATLAGAEKLYGSLRHAAIEACRDDGMRYGTLHRGYADCATSALKGAVAAVDIPAVSAVHSAKAR